MKKIVILGLSFLILIGCSADKKEAKKTEEKEVDTTVSFVAVGDNLIHETVYQDADKNIGTLGDGSYDFKPMYEHVKADIEKADVAFINQETIVGGSELGLSGYPMFNSPSDVAKDLEDTGFNLVNLASNHSLDKGQQGINNALEAFHKTKMVSNGIYESQEAYDYIPVFEENGIKFSFLAYTYGTNGINAPNPYSISYFSDDKVSSDVARAKEIGDVIIVSAHWGDENTFAPNEYQQHYAQLLADLEVDVVIGTHPHTIQPVEWIKGTKGNETLVAYSLGNFVGGMLEVDNVLSGMLNFDVVKDNKTSKVKVDNVKWIPLVIHFEGNQNNIMEERYGYRTYKVSDYNDKLAKEHVLNGYEGQTMSLDYLQAKTQEVIDSKFLK